MSVRISTASGSKRDPMQNALATTRGADRASVPLHAFVTRSKPGNERRE